MSENSMTFTTREDGVIEARPTPYNTASIPVPSSTLGEEITLVVNNELARYLTLRDEAEFIAPEVLTMQPEVIEWSWPEPQIVLAVECHQCCRVSPLDNGKIPPRCHHCGLVWSPVQRQALEDRRQYVAGVGI